MKIRRNHKMRILFITAHRLGDAVLSTASLAFLRKIYPAASFTIICGGDVMDIFTSFPNCEEVIPLIKRSYNRHWLFLWRKMLFRRWDLIIDFRSSLVSFGLYAKKRLIIPGGRRKKHKLEQHWDMLSSLSPHYQNQTRPAMFLPKIWISYEDEAYFRTILPTNAPYIILAPTAGSEDKIYPGHLFYFVALELIKRGYKIVLLYGKGAREASLMADFYHALEQGGECSEHVIDLGGGRYCLRVIAACLKGASLFIGNDSGLMHLASSFEHLPILALFGPTLSKEYAPLSLCSEVLIAPSLEGKEEDGKGVMCLLKPEKLLHKALTMLENKKVNFKKYKFIEGYDGKFL